MALKELKIAIKKSGYTKTFLCKQVNCNRSDLSHALAGESQPRHLRILQQVELFLNK